MFRTFRKILWSMLLCGTFIWFLQGEVFGQSRGLEEGWLWQIFVYPPSEGWESDEGDSIRAALEMVAQEVNERHYGHPESRHPLCLPNAHASGGSLSFGKASGGGLEAGKSPCGGLELCSG